MKILNFLLLTLFLNNGHANVFDSDDRQIFIPTSKPWLAVGKLQIKMGPNQFGSCTGTLIGKDKVITAAHCLIKDTTTGEKINPEDVTFHVGFNRNVSLASSQGATIEVGSQFPTREFHKDWAIITLKNRLGDEFGWLVPMTLSPNQLPFPVSHLGYSYDFNQSLTGHFQNLCYIQDIVEIGYSGNYKKFYHDCDMHGGASGGPIIGWINQTPYIIAINVAESVDPNTRRPYVDGVKYTKETANIASGVFAPINEIFKRSILETNFSRISDLLEQ
ncbi:MAG: trypsin-like serine protease [Bacteriovoracaceae bacterium]|nr:trypsin-like serine protease [Bacteriovoracaceae bacterium]